MANKTLDQCYQLQDKLFALYDKEQDSDIKTRIALAWERIVGRQRNLRGVPPLKPVESRVKARQVRPVIGSALLSLPESVAPAVDADVNVIPSYDVPLGVPTTDTDPGGST